VEGQVLQELAELGAVGEGPGPAGQLDERAGAAGRVHMGEDEADDAGPLGEEFAGAFQLREDYGRRGFGGEGSAVAEVQGRRPSKLKLPATIRTGDAGGRGAGRV
jgi:hypothetical protein